MKELEEKILGIINKVEELHSNKHYELPHKRYQIMAKEIAALIEPYKMYEIDFGGHTKCKIQVCVSNIIVEIAMSGWGNRIPDQDIRITELKKEIEK
jgi:hypothetical protein